MKIHNASIKAEVEVAGGINYTLSTECGVVSMGIGALASVHKYYHQKINAGYDEMREYTNATGLPLVLHGGSGIPDGMIKKAIVHGEAKINVNTELQEAFQKGIRKYIEEEKDLHGTGYDPRKLIGTYATPNMKAKVKEKILLFRTENKV